VKAMILAAGRGERLRPLTDSVPKPLVEIGGDTLIERHLKALAAAGIEEVVINVSHLAEMIETRLGDGSRYGVTICYSHEPGEPLETAGGIARALPLLGANPFIVVNADIWTDFDFANLPTRATAAHLVVTANPPHNPGGDFDLISGRLTRASHNPYTYCGIGVFRPSVFESLTTERAPLGPVLFELADGAQLSGECQTSRWFDIGTIERLALAQIAVGES